MNILSVITDCFIRDKSLAWKQNGNSGDGSKVKVKSNGKRA